MGAAASRWAAVSLADKLDTLVGLFAAGERPTGSRDPFGLRRQAHGLFKMLVDLPGADGALGAADARRAGRRGGGGVRPVTTPLDEAAARRCYAFLLDRARYVLEQRGFDVRNVRAVLRGPAAGCISPLDAQRMLEVLPEFTGTPEFQQLATAFKRVKNIAQRTPGGAVRRSRAARAAAREPCSPSPRNWRSLAGTRAPRSGHRAACWNRAKTTGRRSPRPPQFGPAVDRFFTDVFVMVEDPALRQARLRLMKSLARLILRLADISEIVPQTES